MTSQITGHRLQRKPLISDPGMHHGTCMTHVPWCMSGSLTRGGGQDVPGIPGACAIHNFAVRGPCQWSNHDEYGNISYVLNNTLILDIWCSTIPHLPGCFCPWTFFQNIGFNIGPLYVTSSYSTWIFCFPLCQTYWNGCICHIIRNHQLISEMGYMVVIPGHVEILDTRATARPHKKRNKIYGNIYHL